MPCPAPTRPALVLLGALTLSGCATLEPVPPAPAVSAPAGSTPAGSTSVAPEAPAEPSAQGRTGVLVMAHGGTDDWNAAVEASVAGLRAQTPTALAFGMADHRTLKAGLDSLVAQGADRVVVVRMFLSGASFREQTDYLLGLRATPPAMFMHHGPDGMHMSHGGAGHVPAPVAPAGIEIRTHDEGIMASPRVARILLDRARSLSRDPADEAVLVLAHGMGDEAENDAVLARMEEGAALLTGMGFARVELATLREDWPEARAEAEARIVAFGTDQAAAGRRLLVLPFRLFGFGPYAEVLGDLAYAPGDGLLPHPEIEGWIADMAVRTACAAGWTAPLGSCAAVASRP